MDLSERSSRFQNRHPWELARSKAILHLLKSSSQNFRRILDIGCGDTYLIQEIRQLYPQANCHGVDPQFTDVDLKTLSADRLSLSRNIPNTGDFDLILMADVLEHIDEDQKFYRESVLPRLAREGLIILTVPAFQSLFSAHDTYLKHFRRYSLRSLTTSVQDPQILKLDSGYFFFSLIPVRILEKLFEALNLRSPKGIGAWKGRNFITRFVSQILFVDFLSLRFLKKVGISAPGLSAYFMGKKI